MELIYPNAPPLGHFCSSRTLQLSYFNLDYLLDALYRDLGVTSQEPEQEVETTGSHVTGSDPVRTLEEGAGATGPAPEPIKSSTDGLSKASSGSVASLYEETEVNPAQSGLVHTGSGPVDSTTGVAAISKMAPPPVASALEQDVTSLCRDSSHYSTLNSSHGASRSNYSTLTSTDLDFFSADDAEHVSSFSVAF